MRPVVDDAEHSVADAALLAERRLRRRRHADAVRARGEQTYLCLRLEARAARLGVDACCTHGLRATVERVCGLDQQRPQVGVERRYDVEVVVTREGGWGVPRQIIVGDDDVAGLQARV